MKVGSHEMNVRIVYLSFLGLLLFVAASVIIFYRTLEFSIVDEHNKFIDSFEKYRFVPERFQANSKNTVWAERIVVDGKEKQVFCVHHSSYPMAHMVEVLIRYLTKCKVGKHRNIKSYFKQLSQCYPSLPLIQPAEGKQLFEDDSWGKMVYVSDPIDRFIYHYMWHCLDRNEEKDENDVNRCFKCDNNDLRCFVNHLYDNYVSFLEYNVFRELWSKESEFYPQFWGCGMERYYLKYSYMKSKKEMFFFLREYFRSKFQGNFTLLLTGWGVGKKGGVFREKSNAELEENIEIKGALMKDPETLKKLVTVYAVDFIAFNIDLQDWLVNACPECTKTITRAAKSYRDAYFKHNSNAYEYLSKKSSTVSGNVE